MMKKILKLIILFLSILPLNIKALDTEDIPSKNAKYKSLGYVIDKYDIDIVLRENNTLNITERITAYFNEERHGIYRSIPIKNKIVRIDGSKSSSTSQMTNVLVDNNYEFYKENGNYIIKIGKSKQTFKGEESYVIRYTYNLGKDPLKDLDEFYYNIIGNGWNTVIGGITFKVTLPKEFDQTKLGIYAGEYGSTLDNKINYEVNGNVITGSYQGILEKNEALTMRLELPEGYFVHTGLVINHYKYLVLIFPIIFLMIAILLWHLFGKDEKVIETVEFYPPVGLNSLDVGYLYKGTIGTEDITSLFIYLANKGYIKIAPTEEKLLYSDSKSFKIIKLKEYDGNNPDELKFYNGLFTKKIRSKENKRKKETIMVNEVNANDLYNSFYKVTEKIISNKSSSNLRYHKIFTLNSLRAKAFIMVMMVISFFLINIPPAIEYGMFWEDLVLIVTAASYAFFFVFSLLTSKKEVIYVKGKKKFLVNNTNLVSGLIVNSIFIIFFLWKIIPPLGLDTVYAIGYVLSLLCIIPMAICFKYCQKRTKYGRLMLGKIRGFKNFLETAEKDRLESLVNDNPTYFYDILPYTYVLGVSDIWIKKFEIFVISPPSWYDSYEPFNFMQFHSLMDNTMVGATVALSASKSYSVGSSSSSGGGFSAGGSGGGGGGSW